MENETPLPGNEEQKDLMQKDNGKNVFHYMFRLDVLSTFHVIFARETTFATFCLLSRHQTTSEIGSPLTHLCLVDSSILIK